MKIRTLADSHGLYSFERPGSLFFMLPSIHKHNKDLPNLEELKNPEFILEKYKNKILQSLNKEFFLTTYDHPSIYKGSRVEEFYTAENIEGAILGNLTIKVNKCQDYTPHFLRSHYHMCNGVWVTAPFILTTTAQKETTIRTRDILSLNLIQKDVTRRETISIFDTPKSLTHFNKYQSIKSLEQIENRFNLEKNASNEINGKIKLRFPRIAKYIDRPHCEKTKLVLLPYGSLDYAKLNIKRKTLIHYPQD